MEGFSKTNLYNIMRFYQFYAAGPIFHQLGGKLPWRHHVEILAKSKTLTEAYFYLHQLTETLPEELKSSLPTFEEIE
jgi:hypothetical protein